MSRAACPRIERDGCPVSERKGGCFSDIDHIVPQRFRSLGLLVRKYIQTPENKQRLCRWSHEQKPVESIADIPSEAFMLNAVMTAYEDGFINLSKQHLAQLERMELRTELSELPLEGAA